MHSKPCNVKGCIDYNAKITEAIESYNQANGTRFNGMLAKDVAVFFLGDGIMGKCHVINCGCELRGGGNLISPLHIHYCHQHGGTKPPEHEAEQRTRTGNTPTELIDPESEEAEALLDAVKEAQTAYWDALHKLEEATGLDIDGTQDFQGMTCADLTNQ